MAASRLLLVSLLLVTLACEQERRQPTGPTSRPPEEAVVRFERSGGPGGPDEILTVTGLGHVTWREVRSGAVARLRIPVDELLALERQFDDSRFAELPETVRGPACAACPTLVLSHGVAAGERSVVLAGDPAGHPPALRELVARLSRLAVRAQAARRAAMGGGGTAGDRLENGLEVALSVGSAAVEPGEPLYLQLTLLNPTDRPITLDFPSTRDVDFRVETVEGVVVWSLAESRAALQIDHEIVLAPGESRTFEEVWLGRTATGRTVDPGSYLAVGVIPIRAGGATPPVAFQVR